MYWKYLQAEGLVAGPVYQIVEASSAPRRFEESAERNLNYAPDKAYPCRFMVWSESIVLARPQNDVRLFPRGEIR